MKKILLIVDAQYDFLEGGNLAVFEGTKAMDNLVKHIADHYNEYNEIVLTADWHLPTHCSFKDNGGEWPKHCVQHSLGAAIYQGILDVLDDKKVNYHILTKGTNEDREEYSIFKNPKSSLHLKTFYELGGIEEVDICGIASDVCVLNTIKDGLSVFPNTRFNVMLDCVASIDGGEAINKLIKESERVTEWHE